MSSTRTKSSATAIADQLFGHWTWWLMLPKHQPLKWASIFITRCSVRPAIFYPRTILSTSWFARAPRWCHLIQVHPSTLPYSNTGNDPYIQEGLTSVDSEFCYMSLVWWKFLTSRVILGLPVFDNMLCRDIFAWNVMILATLRDILEEVLNFFQSMQNEGVKADKVLCFWFYQRVPSWVD